MLAGVLVDDVVVVVVVVVEVDTVDVVEVEVVIMLRVLVVVLISSRRSTLNAVWARVVTVDDRRRFVSRNLAGVQPTRFVASSVFSSCNSSIFVLLKYS